MFIPHPHLGRFTRKPVSSTNLKSTYLSIKVATWFGLFSPTAPTDIWLVRSTLNLVYRLSFIFLHFLMFCLFKTFLQIKKPLKNFGGSRGSKGQGSNPNNRINDCCSFTANHLVWNMLFTGSSLVLNHKTRTALAMTLGLLGGSSQLFKYPLVN